MKYFVIIHLITTRDATGYCDHRAAEKKKGFCSTSHTVWTNQGLFERATIRPTSNGDEGKVAKAEMENEQVGRRSEEEWKHWGRRAVKRAVTLCISVLRFKMRFKIHSGCFIVDHSRTRHLWPSAKTCRVPFTARHRHGGRGWIAMDGSERGYGWIGEGRTQEACSFLHVCSQCCLLGLSEIDQFTGIFQQWI